MTKPDDPAVVDREQQIVSLAQKVCNQMIAVRDFKWQDSMRAAIVACREAATMVEALEDVLLDIQLDSWSMQARERGESSAKDRALLVSDQLTPQKAAAVVSLIDDEDPEREELLPAMPDLSGEWAGEPTGMSLMLEIVGRQGVEEIEADGAEGDERIGVIVQALSDAWEAGRDAVFFTECRRIAKLYLED